LTVLGRRRPRINQASKMGSAECANQFESAAPPEGGRERARGSLRIWFLDFVSPTGPAHSAGPIARPCFLTPLGPLCPFFFASFFRCFFRSIFCLLLGRSWTPDFTGNPSKSVQIDPKSLKRRQKSSPGEEKEPPGVKVDAVIDFGSILVPKMDAFSR